MIIKMICSCVNLWLAVFLCAVLLAYLFTKWSYGYWNRRGIQSPAPSFPYGNMWNVGTAIHPCHLMQKFYDQFKESSAPFVGVYVLLWPSVMCLNLDFVKSVMTKDFQHFHDRGIYYNEKSDPLSAHLFALDGDKWRNLRYKLTPTFTSGKMKTMFVTLVAVVEHFQVALEQELKMGDEVEMRDMLGRFTTDVIGSCAFGLDCNSLKDPNAEFRVQSRKVFENPPLSPIKQILVRNFRSLARVMNIKVFHTDVSNFFMRIVKETIDYRESNAIERKDFMDLLIDIKNKSGEEGLTIEEVAAQALIFFLAGFETSSTTMTFALYELARNQEVQDKARASVQEVLKRHNGALTYEAMTEMTYIDQCINESLRMYPPVPHLFRRVSKAYTVPDTDIVLPENMTVTIPVYAIHHDHNIYPNPDVYDPERFTPENVKQRHPYAFLPFGEGPRNCIGLRFGMMQARIGLAMLLNNYKFSICSKSVIPLEIKVESFVLNPKNGLWLNVEKI